MLVVSILAEPQGDPSIFSRARCGPETNLFTIGFDGAELKGEPSYMVGIRLKMANLTRLIRMKEKLEQRRRDRHKARMRRLRMQENHLYEQLEWQLKRVP